MQTELRDTRERAAEADRLEQLLKLSETSQYRSVAARVIARDPSMWFDGITIDKGRWAGVEVNMPVVTTGRNRWQSCVDQSVELAGHAGD